MSGYVFVGERRSALAVRMGVTWLDGRLAAKPIHEALRALGLVPAEHTWLNAWLDSGEENPALDALDARGRTVVALGERASRALSRRGIVHRKMVHPAARGAIRKRERYHAHVAEVLGPLSRLGRRIA